MHFTEQNEEYEEKIQYTPLYHLSLKFTYINRGVYATSWAWGTSNPVAISIFWSFHIDICQVLLEGCQKAIRKHSALHWN